MHKILVVDDDERMLRLFQDILAVEGFEVLAANNGNDALRIAAESSPDLIVLDVMMPDKDGGEVAGDLAENKKTKDIPVIFLTSLATEKDAGRDGEMVAGRLYLSKSINRKDFIKKVREVLNNHNKLS